MSKVIRTKRLKLWTDKWLDRFALDYDIELRENGSYTIETDEDILDYYPKSDKLLTRNTNSWRSNGLEWLKNNLLKDG